MKFSELNDLAKLHAMVDYMDGYNENREWSEDGITIFDAYDSVANDLENEYDYDSLGTLVTIDGEPVVEDEE